MTGTNCDLFTHNQSRSYLNHLVQSLHKLENCTFFNKRPALWSYSVIQPVSRSDLKLTKLLSNGEIL
jgi:hypothetical protein